MDNSQLSAGGGRGVLGESFLMESPVNRADNKSQAMMMRKSIAVRKSIQLLEQSIVPSTSGFSSFNKTPLKLLEKSMSHITPADEFVEILNRSSIEQDRKSVSFNQDNHNSRSEEMDYKSSSTNTPGKPIHQNLWNRSRCQSGTPGQGGGGLPMTPGDWTEDFTATVTDVLYDDHTAMSVHRSLLTDFKEAYLNLSVNVSPIELTMKYQELCEEKVAILKTIMSKVRRDTDQLNTGVLLLESLTNEMRTWGLISALYYDRLNNQDEKMDDLSHNRLEIITKSNSDKLVVDALFEKDSSVREQQIIIDWLEKNARDQLHKYREKFFVQNMCWENTLHALKQQSSGIVTNSTRSIVTEIDPDAPIRQQRPLADHDKEDEMMLLKYLFLFIRAGQLDEAQKLCNRCGQFWRAATLEGWKLYHDPNLTQDKYSTQLLPVGGNPQRDIWKNICWNMCQDSKFSIFEKAIYATLCGNLEQILPACETWEDYLWGYYKVMIDIQVQQELNQFPKMSNRSTQPMPDQYYKQTLNPPEVFTELENTTHDGVRDESKNKFHIIQKYLITNDINGLLEEMGEWNRCLGLEAIPLHLIRFMAHLILVLRSLQLDKKQIISTPVIESYVKVLIDEKFNNLVATYTASLPQKLQVAMYALFLEGITERSQRQECLQWAETANLDVPLITKRVVENIRYKNVEFDPDCTTDLEAVTSEEDRHKIEAIDWLVFDPSQRAEALKQSNAVMRSFLAMKKLEAARLVFSKIPADSIEVITKRWVRIAGPDEQLPAADENAIREYLCIKAYLDAHDSYSDWLKMHTTTEPVKPTVSETATFTDKVHYEHQLRKYELDMDNWKHMVGVQTQTFVDRVYNVLLFINGGWMVDSRDTDDIDYEDSGRHQQMVLLRQLCLPQLCFLLHSTLHATQHYKDCLLMADYLASEQYKLYQVFTKHEVKQLLSKLKESSVCLLDQGYDPIGLEKI